MTVSELIEQLKAFPGEADVYFWNSDERGRIHGMELSPHKIVETNEDGINRIESCVDSEKDLDVLQIEMGFAVEEF